MRQADPDKKVEFLSAHDFSKAYKESEYISRETNEILRDAKRKAQEIIENAKSEQRRELEAQRLQAVEHFDQYIDDEKLRAHADSIKVLLADVAKIKEEFDRIEPWLIPLLRSCLRKLVGHLDAEELIARVTSQAIKELKSEYKQDLLVHPDDAEQIQTAMQNFGKHFTGVSSFYTSPDVQPGTLRLENEIYGVVLDLEAQVETVLQGISAVLPAEAGELE